MRKLRKLSLSLLIFSVIISSIIFPSFSYTIEDGQAKTKVVKDVDLPSSWAEEEINQASIYGIIEKDLFRDFQRDLTRKDLANIGVTLYEKLTGKIAHLPSSNPFIDTKNEKVLKAYSLKIVQGVGNGKFEPDKKATREHISIVLYNVAKLSKPNLNLNVSTTLNFKDADTIPKYALEPVKYMVHKGIIKGKSNNLLSLNDTSSLEQGIILAKRIYEIILQESGEVGKGFFWKVSGGNSEVYVLGSIHIANNSIYPLNSKMEEMFNKSGYLVLEADVTDIDEEYIRSIAFYNDGSTLKDNISKETYDLFVKKINDMGLNPQAFENMKPWYISMIIDNLGYVEGNYDSDLGIDNYFYNKAVGKKEILEIEGAKFQLDLFNKLSPKVQEEMLMTSLYQSNENKHTGENLQKEALDYLLDLWKRGETSELEKYIGLSSEAESSEFDKIFWHERNKNMTEKIVSYLSDDSKKVYFVIVGAGHLVGETGVIPALQSKGYKVEQIK